MKRSLGLVVLVLWCIWPADSKATADPLHKSSIIIEYFGEQALPLFPIVISNSEEASQLGRKEEHEDTKLFSIYTYIIRDDKNLIIGDRTTGFRNGDTVPVIVAADDSAGRSRQNPTRNIVNAQILTVLKVGVLLQQDDLRILVALSLRHPLTVGNLTELLDLRHVDINQRASKREALRLIVQVPVFLPESVVLLGWTIAPSPGFEFGLDSLAISFDVEAFNPKNST